MITENTDKILHWWLDHPTIDTAWIPLALNKCNHRDIVVVYWEMWKCEACGKIAKWEEFGRI